MSENGTLLRQENTLPIGFPNKTGGAPLRRVVFGRRMNGDDKIKVEDSPESELVTQKNLLLARTTIVEFGAEQRAPFLDELLELTRADREDLIETYNAYMKRTQGTRRAEELDGERLKLGFGWKVGDDVFDVVVLCDKSNLITGYDEIPIEDTSTGSYEWACKILVSDIRRLEQTGGGGKTFSETVTLDMLRTVDATDLNAMLLFHQKRGRNFRLARKQVAADDGAGSSTDS